MNEIDFRQTVGQRRRGAFVRLGLRVCVAAVVGLAVAIVPISFGERQWRVAKAKSDAVLAQQRTMDGAMQEFVRLSQSLAEARAHRQAIATLHASRWPAADVLVEIARWVPLGLRLDRVSGDVREIRIEGVATAQARVTEYQRALRALPGFRRVKIVDMRMTKVKPGMSKGDGASTLPSIRRFALRVELDHKPQEPQEVRHE